MNKAKFLVSKKMIFQSESFPQNSSCSICKKFKCDCRKNQNEIKTETEICQIASIIPTK